MRHPQCRGFANSLPGGLLSTRGNKNEGQLKEKRLNHSGVCRKFSIAKPDSSPPPNGRRSPEQSAKKVFLGQIVRAKGCAIGKLAWDNGKGTYSGGWAEQGINQNCFTHIPSKTYANYKSTQHIHSQQHAFEYICSNHAFCTT